MTEIMAKINQRLNAVDFLRGVVMIIMLLDHVREYLHTDAFRFSPTDLSKTNVLLFFTRWITHFCAPTFVFLSGISIYLQLMRGKSRSELSKFLLTRGLWLIFLEFTVIRFSMVFNLDYSFLGFAEVIWIFGVSMIVLAGLIYFPAKIVGTIGITMILLHNLLDKIQIPPTVAMASTPPPDFWQKIWLVLHQPGIVPLFDEATFFFVAYPLIPWVGVMAAGYFFGKVYEWEMQRRQKFLIKLGSVLLLSFVILRAINIYGDPQPWQWQNNMIFTFLSFINVTKYPVSLLFLLLTLGAAILVLVVSEKVTDNNPLSRIVITFGRVPLFYFILQMFWSHGLAVLINYLAGKGTDYLFLNFPKSFSEAPPNAGFDLWAVYLVWLGGLIVLYPVCRWYAEIKRRQRGFPFSYL